MRLGSSVAIMNMMKSIHSVSGSELPKYRLDLKKWQSKIKTKAAVRVVVRMLSQSLSESITTTGAKY